MKNFLS